MGWPVTPPRPVLDTAGRLRIKIKRGRPARTYGEGPHAHYFNARGERVSHEMRAVAARSTANYRAVRWDLPEEKPPDPSADPPRLEEAFALAARSATFRTFFDETARAGWVIDIAPADGRTRCCVGSHTIFLQAHPRSAFVARLVQSVALARALAAPLPSVDPAAPDFVHTGSLAVLRREGEAALFAAIIRDEILANGGADIGGPGLRGLQIEAYDVFRRENLPIERAIDAVAFSVDGPLVRDFDATTGPRVAVNLRLAFHPARGLSFPAMSSDVVDFLAQLRSWPALSAQAVAAACGAKLSARGLLLQNPYLVVYEADLPYGPFERVELREPAKAIPKLEPRLLLTPRVPMTQADLLARYGLGEPRHVEAQQEGDATVRYPLGRRALYATFALDGARSVRVLSVHGA